MSRLLIVVEGPTGAGKTTLVERLQKRFSLPVVHRACPPGKLNDPKLVEEWFENALLNRSSDGLILDRWVYSNGVYGRVLKNQPVLDAAAVQRLERKALDAFGTCATIHVSATPDSLLRRINRRTKPTWDRLRDTKILSKLVAGYGTAFNDCTLPKVQIITADVASTYRDARQFIEGQLSK